MSQGYITLDSVVTSWLARKKEPMHKYAHALSYAIDGLKELHYDVMGEVKTVVLPIDANTKSVNFPPDYSNYTKVGVCVNGNLITLGLNPYMCTEVKHDDCGDIDTFEGGNLKGTKYNVDSDGEPSWGGYWFYNYNGSGGAAYGHGGGFSKIGYYKEDREHRRFLFNSDIRAQEIVLEYVTNGYAPGELTLVWEQAKDALIAWIEWIDCRYTPNMAQYAEVKKREFALARRNLGYRVTSITPEEFVQMNRRAYKQTTKA
jgi:hypothetical protein